MNYFMAQFNRIIFNNTAPVSPPSGLDFIRTKKLILQGLTESRKRKTAVGIYAAPLGEGMFITGVEDIFNHHDEPIIAFNRYDITGAILQRNTLSLNEISAICKFDIPYRNPVLR